MNTILDLVKSALWPAVALLALLLFYPPINTIVESVSKRADQINTIKIGSLELNIQKSDLPNATPEVAAIVTGLDAAGLRVLMITGDIPSQFCTATKTEEVEAEIRAIDLIEALGAADVSQSTSNNCTTGLTIRLTDAGKSARKFVYELVASQFATSKAG